MCGIAGIAGVEIRNHWAEREGMFRMLGVMRHRGPDEFGVYQDGRATLGSARLSIIDLETGQQPISNEDGSLWIVYNGEIFNYIELREELQTRGHRFATGSDTETVLHLFEDEGPDCLRRLNGQFAFAIWDARAHRLFLARDRIGIRPLFYSESGGVLRFASEAKALFAEGTVGAELDPVGLCQVFTYWSPLPGRTCFRGIHELPAGRFLNYSNGRIAVTKYWALQFPGGDDSKEVPDSEYLEEFRHLLVDATKIRLRADVPVGAYLSGGLDSSVIAKIISSHSVTRLATFSIAFCERQYDESEYQLRMAGVLGTRHELVRATHADIGRAFPEVVWHTEAALTRTAPAPMFLLSRLARDCGYKVVLTGEGADEMLAGYDIFKEAAIRRFWARHPESRLRPLLLQQLYSDIPGLSRINPAFLTAFFQSGLTDVNSPYYSHAVRWRNNGRTRRFLSEAVLAEVAREGEPTPEVPAEFEKWTPLERGQYLESTVFLSQYLLASQGDRVGMAHSVESRLPYLDYRVMEFCCRLPGRMKLRGLHDKYLLRLFGRELLPAEIWKRPKRPYRAPIQKSFFVKPAQEYVRELLSPGQIRATGVFGAAGVARFVRRAESGVRLGETDEMALAGILSTQLLHHLFVSRFPAVSPISEAKDRIRVCGLGATATDDMLAAS